MTMALGERREVSRRIFERDQVSDDWLVYAILTRWVPPDGAAHCPRASAGGSRAFWGLSLQD
jgi:hypothetical protein